MLFSGFTVPSSVNTSRFSF